MRPAAACRWARLTATLDVMKARVDLPRVISVLVALVETRCRDTSTLAELTSISGRPELWPGAYDLFLRIRQKTLRAEREHDQLASAQYCFEEACAKTLYNLSGRSAPFDADSPEWIVPNAVALAQRLALPESAVQGAVLETEGGA